MRARPLSAQSAPASVLKRFIADHPLLSYIGLAFGISWTFLIADALGSHGLIPFRLTLSGPGVLLVILMGYGPTLAALIISWAAEGMTGVRRLLGRLLPGRAGLRWYALALAGPIGLAWMTGTVQQLAGAPHRPLPAPVYQVILMGMIGSFLHAIANGEELGWRGYALPLLQARYSALRASLLLGVIWFAFHLPIMFTVGGVGGSQTIGNALPFLATTLALSVVVTWIFNTTHGSVLPIILLHGSLNTWLDLLSAQGASAALVWVGVVPLMLLAALVVLVFGPARLSHEPATALPQAQAAASLDHDRPIELLRQP